MQVIGQRRANHLQAHGPTVHRNRVVCEDSVQAESLDSSSALEAAVRGSSARMSARRIAIVRPAPRLGYLPRRSLDVLMGLLCETVDSAPRLASELVVRRAAR